MQRLRSRVAIATFTLVVIVVARSGMFDDVSVAGLRARVEAWGALGPVAFMTLMIAGFFFPGPEIVLVALGGVVFGMLEGFAYAWTAAVIGTSLAFVLVRQAVGGASAGRGRERFRRLAAIDQRLADHGFVTVAMLRLMLFLAPPLSWVLGASRVRFRDHLLGTAVGIAPGTALTVYLADGASAAQSRADLFTPHVVVPAVVIVVGLVAGGVLARRLLGGALRAP